MITDSQTDFVYFSELIKKQYPIETEGITDIFYKHSIPFAFLKGTKDIWCRDYMPVQISQNSFLGFKYNPKYLKGYENIKSDPMEVCNANGIQSKFCGINLDGGNVVKCAERVIISERVFSENKIPRAQLIDSLESLFDAEAIFIPDIKADMTGHSDGMVRFINKDTILVNELEHEYKYWRIGMEKVISKYNLNYIEVPWFLPSVKSSLSAIGCYINFLEVSNLIILPRFEVNPDIDQKVEALFKQIYPNRCIESIQVNKIAIKGGVLNCITWNILR